MMARDHRRQETALHVVASACCVEKGHSCLAAPIASPTAQQTISTYADSDRYHCTMDRNDAVDF